MQEWGLLEYGWAGATALLGFLMWATQVNPRQAVSNLSEWAVSFGIRNQPQWLKSPDADRIVRHFAGLAFVLMALAAAFLFLGAGEMDGTKQICLLAGTALIGGTIVWNLIYPSEMAKPSKGTVPEPQPGPSAPLASTTGLIPQIEAARQRLLARRNALEQAMYGSGGQLVAHEFQDDVRLLLPSLDGKAAYAVPITPCNATSIWLNKYTSVKRFARSLAIKGDLVDIADLREARQSFTLEIGQRAFLTMSDDAVIQLLVVRVRFYAAGDDSDEAHLRYEIYKPAENLLRAI